MMPWMVRRAPRVLCCLVCLWVTRTNCATVFSMHGIGGITGGLLTGIFAQRWVTALGASGLPQDGFMGGWLDGNWIQVWLLLFSHVLLCFL